ncbi:MAG: M23 family metallopeptidase [Synergistaceae bacterium]|nr:M23 family metallopeptidase [Synergistaceae bacterium]
MKEFDNAIFIRHGDDFATFCGGLGIIYVTPGQQVTPETRIGLVGEMVDPGLQFNILKKGKAVDPALYLE